MSYVSNKESEGVFFRKQEPQGIRKRNEVFPICVPNLLVEQIHINKTCLPSSGYLKLVV